MRKRIVAVILLLFLAAVTVAPAALASHSAEPVGSCPTGFHLHHAGMHDHHEHDQEMVHKHVGLDSDLNGDGYWCVKHVSANQHIHVHVDNNLPLS